MKRRLKLLVDRLRRLLPGASLVREARREQARAGGIGKTERAVAWTKAQVEAAFETSRYAFLWILLVGLAGLYLIPSEVRLWQVRLRLSFFESANEAAEFLQTLWQVEASVLALSITVIIFAFQAVSTSRQNIKLYEFAEDVHLFPVFYVGVVGLIVDGLVLLGFDNGAPAGGAASWAVVVSGSTFPLLALLFTRTVRSLDPDELHRRRLARIREEAHRAAEQEIFERFARDLLERRCSEAGIELRLFLAGSPPAGSREIAAPLSGHVRDIDPKRLKSLTEGGLSGVKLLVYVGASVAEGQTIIVLPPSATKKLTKRARQVVHIEEVEG
jgi:hypothetical protein